jgi:hypothetical protein
MIIRRNAAPSRPATSNGKEEGRKPLTRRVEEMGSSHVAAGIGAGALGSAAGVIMVGQGWVGPKTTAGVLMGSGVATTAAGWYWEADHVMAAGLGLTAAGAFSLTNQFAIDAYEAMEKRAEEKRDKQTKEQAEQDRGRRNAEARDLIEAEAKRQQMRNSRRIVVVDADGEVIEESQAAA